MGQLWPEHTVGDSEPKRQRRLESVHRALFAETPTHPRTRNNPSKRQSRAETDSPFNLKKYEITGFPRCVELTAEDGSREYMTFEMLRRHTDGKVREMASDLSK